jgi:hypothetical protein
MILKLFGIVSKHNISLGKTNDHGLPHDGVHCHRTHQGHELLIIRKSSVHYSTLLLGTSPMRDHGPGFEIQRKLGGSVRPTQGSSSPLRVETIMLFWPKDSTGTSMEV